MFTRHLRTLAHIAAIAALCIGGQEMSGASAVFAAPPDDSTRDLTYFLRRLRTVDHLPELEQARTAMSSTWDRSGGNLDGWDFKRVQGDRNVLLDVEGPGCIHRIFTGLLGNGKDVLGRAAPGSSRLQIYFDHAEKPLFDMPVDEFFDDRDGPFPYPLVFHKTYPGILFPIPFARHCRVQLVNPAAPNWGNFWQITYTTYPSEIKVKSLTWPLNEAEKAEVAQVREAWLEAESRPPATPDQWTVVRDLDVDRGAVGDVALEGCGIIRQMRVGLWPPTPELLRGVRLQICWDGSNEPSVDVPLGYFFGNADYGYSNEIHFNSLILGVTPSQAYCTLPMPFSDGAFIRFENRSDQRAHRIRMELDVETRNTLPDNWGRFHTTWSERRAAGPDGPRFGPKDVPAHLVLERKGRGKYVGTLLHVHWPHTDWWGEGDWLIWTDEEGWPPSYHGTGSEEYFNSGWCSFDRKAVSGFVKTRPGEVALYSFHLNDAFQFQRSIRVAEETFGMDGAGMIGDTIIHRDHPVWGSTAFWYASPLQPAVSTPELIQPR